MEELFARCQSDLFCSEMLGIFAMAHILAWQATDSIDHARFCVPLMERRIPLLGKLQHFMTQGQAMCNLAGILRSKGFERYSEAATWFQRARDVGAAHGFFSLESSACIGLALAAKDAGRHEEGVALLRNALVAAELNELDDPVIELVALDGLIHALFQTNSIDEVGPLLLRYRGAAEDNPGCHYEISCLLFSARLHEVLCICTTRLGTPDHDSVLASSTAIASVFHRLHRARGKT